MKPETIPILVYKNEDTGKSPLQHVLDENNINSTNLILKIIIKYQNNPCFNYLVDPLIKDLIQKGIDLKEYFDSDLPLYRIKDERFPSIHSDPSTKIIGIKALYPQDVLSMYKDHIDDIYFKKKDEKANKHSIEYFLVNLPESLTQNPIEFMKKLVET